MFVNLRTRVRPMKVKEAILRNKQSLANRLPEKKLFGNHEEQKRALVYIWDHCIAVR